MNKRFFAFLLSFLLLFPLLPASAQDLCEHILSGQVADDEWEMINVVPAQEGVDGYADLCCPICYQIVDSIILPALPVEAEHPAASDDEFQYDPEPEPEPEEVWEPEPEVWEPEPEVWEPEPEEWEPEPEPEEEDWEPEPQIVESEEPAQQQEEPRQTVQQGALADVAAPGERDLGQPAARKSPVSGQAGNEFRFRNFHLYYSTSASRSTSMIPSAYTMRKVS